MSDADLSQAWQGGNRRAGAILIGRYEAPIRRSRKRRVGTATDDVAQEVWAAVTRMIPSYEARSSFRTWLFAIANNHVRVQYRARTRAARIQAAATDLFDVPGPDPAEVYRWRQDLHRLALGLGALPKPLQRIVALYYFERRPASAIGRQLSLPENTVRSRVRRARELLGSSLDRRLGPEVPATSVEAWLLQVDLPRPAAPAVHHAA
jgi:RNA polymerase sigma-70 factor (ECF subfamily)